MTPTTSKSLVEEFIYTCTRVHLYIYTLTHAYISLKRLSIYIALVSMGRFSSGDDKEDGGDDKLRRERMRIAEMEEMAERRTRKEKKRKEKIRGRRCEVG